MLLSEAPMVALKATNNNVKVEALIRCSPKFMASMNASGASMTAHPKMLMPPVSENSIMMAPLLAKYQAMAPVMERPAAIQPNTAFMNPRSSATNAVAPVVYSEVLFPLKMRGGS